MREQVGFLLLYLFSEMSFRYLCGVATGIVIATKYDFKPVVNYAETLTYNKINLIKKDYEEFLTTDAFNDINKATKKS